MKTIKIQNITKQTLINHGLDKVVLRHKNGSISAFYRNSDGEQVGLVNGKSIPHYYYLHTLDDNLAAIHASEGLTVTDVIFAESQSIATDLVLHLNQISTPWTAITTETYQIIPQKQYAPGDKVKIVDGYIGERFIR